MQLAKYTNLKQIAESPLGEGAVFRARAPDGSYRCIKTAQDGHQHRLKFEAKTLPKLRHPNIITFYDSGEENGTHYLVTELMQRSVEDLLTEGPLDYKRAIKIVQQAAIGIEHAHRQGVLHLDLKPANLLIDQQENVKVCDFSAPPTLEEKLSTSLGTKSSSRLSYTLDYLAPEIRQGDEPTAASDVYSLGIVLYRLVAGELPNAYSKPLREIADVPASLDELIKQCISKKPAERPTMEHIIAALPKIEKQEPGFSLRTYALETTKKYWKEIVAGASALVIGTVLASAVTRTPEIRRTTTSFVMPERPQEYPHANYWYRVEKRGDEWFVMFPVGLSNFGPERSIPIEEGAVTELPAFLQRAEAIDIQGYHIRHRREGWVPQFMKDIIDALEPGGITRAELDDLSARMQSTGKGYETITGLEANEFARPPFRSATREY